MMVPRPLPSVLIVHTGGTLGMTHGGDYNSTLGPGTLISCEKLHCSPTAQVALSIPYVSAANAVLCAVSNTAHCVCMLLDSIFAGLVLLPVTCLNDFGD